MDELIGEDMLQQFVSTKIESPLEEAHGGEGVVVRVEPETEDPAVSEYRLAIYFLDSDWEGADLVEEFLAENH